MPVTLVTCTVQVVFCLKNSLYQEEFVTSAESEKAKEWTFNLGDSMIWQDSVPVCGWTSLYSGRCWVNTQEHIFGHCQCFFTEPNKIKTQMHSNKKDSTSSSSQVLKLRVVLLDHFCMVSSPPCMKYSKSSTCLLSGLFVSVSLFCSIIVWFRRCSLLRIFIWHTFWFWEKYWQ